MPNRFVAPKRLDTLDDVRKALQRIQEQLDANDPQARAALVTTDVTLRAGETVRISPRQGEVVYAKLPKAQADNFGSTITIILERPAGTLRLSAQAPDTVNGVRATNFTAATRIVVQSNGLDQWVSTNALPSTSPGGSALDAEYVLGAAHASLPNGRVATDSTEIDAVLTTPNVVSWALNAASVGFSKLADLTGLSVLGRAATTTGVMAAITATAARQVLRNNDAGNALTWGFPIEAQAGGVDQGDIHTINREDGRLTVSAGVATLGPPTTIVDTQSGTLNAYALPATLQHGDTLAIVCSADVTLNGIVAKPAGFGFYLNVSGAAARLLTINDESLSATALDRLSLPADLASRNPPGASFWVSYASTRWLVVERAITEVQDDGVSQGFARTVNALSSTSNAAVATIAAGVASLSYQRAALTGDVTAAANSNTTAIAAGVIVDADVNAAAAIALTKTGAMTGDVTKASGSAASALGTGVVLDTHVGAAAAIALSKLATQAEATVAGRAMAAGTGVPVALTGTQLGEIIRRNSVQTISGASGDITITLANTDNKVVIESTGDVRIQGVTGASIPNGRDVQIDHVRASGTGVCTLQHQSGVSTEMLLPNNVDYKLGHRGSVQLGLRSSFWRVQNLCDQHRFENITAATAAGDALAFSKRVTFTASGATGTDIDVTVWSAAAPFALRILSATLRVSTAAGTACALRTASAGGGSVVLPDATVGTQTFTTATTGPKADNAVATATVAAAGSLFLRIDRAVAGELLLECVRT